MSSELTGTFMTSALDMTTTFTLKATNAEGEVTKTAIVTVESTTNAPAVDSFAANPTTVEAGESSTLTWMTTNATSVDVLAGSTSVVTGGDADGSFMVTPDATTTYTLVAKADDGTTAMGMVTVTVNVPGAPVVASFTGTPAAVNAGEASTLSWNVMDADSIDITDGAGTSVYSGTDAMGTASVSPMMTTTYTLSATNGTGTNTDTVTITVNPPMGAAVDAFTANPTTVMLGMSSDLSWMVQRATAVEIMAGGVVLNTTADQMGTFTVTPTITTEYTLMARNTAGDAMAMQTVTVTAGAPVVNDFSASPNPVAVGGTATLSWDVIGADTVRVLEGTTELANTTMNVGTVAATVTSTMTVYTLEISNQTGGNTAQVIVYGHDAPVINDFAATPGVLATATATITLTWDASNVQDLSLTANGTAVPGFAVIANTMGTTDETGMVDIVISADTTFVLTASSQAGTVMSTIDVQQAVVELEPNDDASTALGVTPGTPILGTIAVGDDEDFYRFTVPAGGWVRAETDDGSGACPFDTQLTLTSTDGVTVLQFDDDGGVGTCSLIDPVTDAPARNMAAGTYYIMVGSFSTRTGDYQLTLEVGAPGCGNMIAETGEQCDDGNTTPGDGCDATCGFEPIFTYAAPGALQIDAGNMLTDAQVDIMEITVTSTSYLFTQTLTSTAPPSCNVDTRMRLFASDGVTELGNDDSDGISSCSAIDATVDAWATLAPGTYYLTVEEDGRNNTIGNYFIGITATPIGVCGNFVAEGTEQCDDGNTAGGDGCDANCQIEAAGTFTAPGAEQVFTMQSIDPIGEQDVYAITVTADTYLIAETFVDATAGTCTGADTVLRLFDAGGTQIGTDDEGGVGSCSRFDGNDAFARLAPGTYFVQVEEYLNNGLIPMYELVLEGVVADVCGNGFVDGTGEVCDDGNTTPGDGCNATCQLEGTIFAEVEPNGSTATANDPGLNALGSVTASGVVDLGNDQDFYSFTVPAGGADLNVITYTTAGNTATCASGTDTEVFLYDSAGTQIANNDDGNPGGNGLCSLLNQTGMTAGTYYISVEYYTRNFDPSSAFPYLVDITLQ